MRQVLQTGEVQCFFLGKNNPHIFVIFCSSHPVVIYGVCIFRRSSVRPCCHVSSYLQFQQGNSKQDRHSSPQKKTNNPKFQKTLNFRISQSTWCNGVQKPQKPQKTKQRHYLHRHSPQPLHLPSTYPPPTTHPHPPNPLSPPDSNALFWEVRELVLPSGGLS